MQNPISLSLLDLASVQEGKSISQTFQSSLLAAQKAEELGYKRFWMAEHHNLAGIASSATSVLLGWIAQGTKTIRVGSGGIMLPNHSPLVIAEQFGTLENLFPGRIDLGLGRAPGTDRPTMRALRRDMDSAANDFPELVRELQHYLDDPAPEQKLIAIPGAGTKVPIWILGSSLFSAQLAAAYGLPYAFAGHFAPDLMLQAFEIYHREFQASKVLQKPYTMVCIQAAAADTDERAQFLATTLYQRFLGIIRNQRTLGRPPVESMDGIWNEMEKAHIESTFRFAVIGGPEKVKTGLRKIQEITRADELMVCSEMFDVRDRLRSLELLAAAAS
ncbi:MAG: LLM class flavin-dependent oxidoreductase [Bdellovibrionota bacterium]